MKIVDEKGKLFGKLNLIDLLVVLVLIAALLFFAFRFTRGSGANPVSASTKLTYTAMVPGVTPQLYEEVQRQLAAADYHDQLMASGELLNGYVVAVEAAPHINYMNDDNGAVIATEEQGDEARYDLTFTVEVNVPNPIVNEVGTQEVRVGKSHILKTTRIEFTSTIITCDWN